MFIDARSTAMICCVDLHTVILVSAYITTYSVLRSSVLWNLLLSKIRDIVRRLVITRARTANPRVRGTNMFSQFLTASPPGQLSDLLSNANSHAVWRGDLDYGELIHFPFSYILVIYYEIVWGGIRNTTPKYYSKLIEGSELSIIFWLYCTVSTLIRRLKGGYATEQCAICSNLDPSTPFTECYKCWRI